MCISGSLNYSEGGDVGWFGWGEVGSLGDNCNIEGVPWLKMKTRFDGGTGVWSGSAGGFAGCERAFGRILQSFRPAS